MIPIVALSIIAIAVIFLGCGPNGDELFKQANEVLKSNDGKRAVEAGSDDAAYFLAIAYRDGIGVEKSLSEASSLLYKARCSSDPEIETKAKQLATEVEKELYPSFVGKNSLSRLCLRAACGMIGNRKKGSQRWISAQSGASPTKVRRWSRRRKARDGIAAEHR